MNDFFLLPIGVSPTGGRRFLASRDLGVALLRGLVLRFLVDARDTQQWDKLAALPPWAKAMVLELGERAGVKDGDVRAVVGDD